MFIKKFNDYLERSAKKAEHRRMGDALYNEADELMHVIFFVLENFESKKDLEMKAMIAINLFKDFLCKKENFWGTEKIQKAWLSVPGYKIFLLQKKLEEIERVIKEQSPLLEREIRGLKRYINFSTNKEGRPQETSS